MFACTTMDHPRGRALHLRQIGLLQLLEQDPRPTFILDEAEANNLFVYHNPALAKIGNGQLLATLRDHKSRPHSKNSQNKTQTDFLKWVNAHSHLDVPCMYQAHSWSKIVLESKWAVVVGVAQETSTHIAATPESTKYARSISRTKGPTLDWTDELPPLKMSPHVVWARSIDWSKTPLGPMSTWSSQLRSIANLVMQDPRPAVVFYGPDLIMIYNEAEIELLGGFHPCMGMSARVALSSVWPQYFEPIIAQNLAGETVVKIDTAIHMVRNGFMEETYFSLKFIPILDSEGATVGHYEPLTETVSVIQCELSS